MPQGFKGTELSQEMSQSLLKEVCHVEHFKGVSCGAQPAWAGRVQSGKDFPSRRARLSSDFVLISHKQ